MSFSTYETKIEGVRIIRGKLLEDARGNFEECFHYGKFLEQNLPISWLQHNVSRNFGNVLRGLHIQREKAQGKLVRCVHGTIYDVWVDLRRDSPTFKKWETITLSSANAEAVYLPPGLAHGFFVMSKVAVVDYLCSTLYDPATDGGIRYNDPDLAITWPIDDEISPLVSAKDMALPTLAEYLESLG